MVYWSQSSAKWIVAGLHSRLSSQDKHTLESTSTTIIKKTRSIAIHGVTFFHHTLKFWRGFYTLELAQFEGAFCWGFFLLLFFTPRCLFRREITILTPMNFTLRVIKQHIGTKRWSWDLNVGSNLRVNGLIHATFGDFLKTLNKALFTRRNKTNIPSEIFSMFVKYYKMSFVWKDIRL